MEDTLGTPNRLRPGQSGILAIILSLGLIFYIHDTSKSRASEKAKVPWAAPKGEPASAGGPAGASGGAPKTEVVISAPPAATDKSGDKPPANPGPATRPATQPAAIAKSKSAVPLSATPLSDGKAKMDAGDLLGARRILNAALISGKLSDPEASQTRSMLNEINATVVFSPKRFADDEFGGTYSVQTGELLTKIAQQHDITWQYLCRVNGLADPKKLRAGATIKV